MQVWLTGHFTSCIMHCQSWYNSHVIYFTSMHNNDYLSLGKSLNVPIRHSYATFSETVRVYSICSEFMFNINHTYIVHMLHIHNYLKLIWERLLFACSLTVNCKKKKKHCPKASHKQILCIYLFLSLAVNKKLLKVRYWLKANIPLHLVSILCSVR